MTCVSTHLTLRRMTREWLAIGREPGLIHQIRQVIAFIGPNHGQVLVRNCQELNIFSTYACNRNIKTG